MPRLSVDLDDTQSERLQQIAGELGDTQVGVTRVALRLLVRAVSAAKAGGQIAIIGADGKVCLLSGSWDDVQTGARA